MMPAWAEHGATYRVQKYEIPDPPLWLSEAAFMVLIGWRRV